MICFGTSLKKAAQSDPKTVPTLHVRPCEHVFWAEPEEGNHKGWLIVWLVPSFPGFASSN